MVWRGTGDKPLPEPMPAQFTDAYMRHPQFTDAYMRHKGEIMACRLAGAKPLSKPMLVYC